MLVYLDKKGCLFLKVITKLTRLSSKVIQVSKLGLIPRIPAESWSSKEVTDAPAEHWPMQPYLR